MSTGEDSVREATRAYVAAAFRLIQTHADSVSDENDYDWEWVRASDQIFRFQQRKTPWWRDWAVRNDAEFRKLPERVALVALLRQDPEVSILIDRCVGTTTTSLHVDDRMLTDHLLWELGKSLGRSELDLSNFDEAYAAWDAELRSSTFRHVNVAPLWGFDMQAETLDLGDGVVIERLSDDVIGRLFSVGLDPCPRRINPSPHVVIVPARLFGIRVVRDIPRTVDRDTSDVEEATSNWTATNDLFEDVLVALRLFQEGNVATPGFASFFAAWPLKGATTFGGLRDFSAPSARQRFGYTLPEDQLGPFQDFLTCYRRMTTTTSNELAFRRFAYAADRARAEDQIIDAMIAAESLLLRGGGGELKFRLALRGAKFLHDQPEQRRSTFRFLKNAYDVRSAIAHGSTPDPSSLKASDGSRCKNLQEFAREVQRVLRIAMQKAVRRIASQGAFTDEKWDELTLG